MQTVAQTGKGVDEVVEKIDEPPRVAGVVRRARAAPGATGARRDRGDRGDRAAPPWGNVHERTELDDLAEQVVAGESDPYAAADTLLETYTEQ